jgi:hypothetical protein
MEILAQAVAVCRNALEADLRRELRNNGQCSRTILELLVKNRAFAPRAPTGRNCWFRRGLHRSALEISTREQFPEYSAMLENNLGILLQEQARRRENAMGTELLPQAVIAYRNASKTFTREQRPQQWAMVNKHLGVALAQQALRVDDTKGEELLARAFREQATCVGDAKKGEMLRQATLAYEADLEVYSHKTFHSEHENVGKSLKTIKTLFSDTDLRAN